MLLSFLRNFTFFTRNKIEFISSTSIARELSLNSVQVRKDLALISKSDGKPGRGFNVSMLISDLENFLGLNNVTDAVIVGAGKLGMALLGYKGFEKNIDILMAFDSDKSKCDNKKIFYIDKMEDLIKRLNIHIGIIAVPKEEAQNVCDTLVKAGVKAIWNFAPTNLIVPSKVIIKNEDLSASLLILLKSLNKK